MTKLFNNIPLRPLSYIAEFFASLKRSEISIETLTKFALILSKQHFSEEKSSNYKIIQKLGSEMMSY
jgi:hypothetical protein